MRKDIFTVPGLAEQPGGDGLVERVEHVGFLPSTRSSSSREDLAPATAATWSARPAGADSRATR
jgi:hypothetical protein